MLKTEDEMHVEIPKTHHTKSHKPEDTGQRHRTNTSSVEGSVALACGYVEANLVLGMQLRHDVESV